MVAIQCLLQGHSPLGKLSMWVVLKRNKYSYLLNYSELKVSRWVCLLMQCSSLFEPTVRISWGKNVEITCQGAHSLPSLARLFTSLLLLWHFLRARSGAPVCVCGEGQAGRSSLSAHGSLGIILRSKCLYLWSISVLPLPPPQVSAQTGLELPV